MLRPQRLSSVQDSINLTCLRERHHLLSFNAVVARPADRLFEHRDDVVAGTPGKRAEIAFLVLAGLVVGADPAVDGDLSQLDMVRNSVYRLLEEAGG